MADIGIAAIYAAAKQLDAELHVTSWSGFNLAGDKKSIAEVTRLQHEVARLQAIVDGRTEVAVTATDIDDNVDDAMCLAIIRNYIQPDPATYAEGRRARDEDLGFHECPYAQHTSLALSWRFGWNERALEINGDAGLAQRLVDFFS